MLLRVVAESLKPVKLFSQQLPTFLLFRDRRSLVQQCWIRLHSSSNIVGTTHSHYERFTKTYRVVSFPRRTAGSIIVGSSCIRFAHYCQHARSLRYERICLKKAREAHLIHKARTIEPLGSNKRDGLYVIIM